MGKVGSYHHRKNEVGNDFLLPLLPTAALAATHLAVRTGFAGEASTTTNGDEAPNSLPPLSSFTLPLLSSVREIGKGQLGLQDMGREMKRVTLQIRKKESQEARLGHTKGPRVDTT